MNIYIYIYIYILISIGQGHLAWDMIWACGPIGPHAHIISQTRCPRPILINIYIYIYISYICIYTYIHIYIYMFPIHVAVSFGLCVRFLSQASWTPPGMCKQDATYTLEPPGPLPACKCKVTGACDRAVPVLCNWVCVFLQAEPRFEPRQAEPSRAQHSWAECRRRLAGWAARAAWLQPRGIAGWAAGHADVSSIKSRALDRASRNTP